MDCSENQSMTLHSRVPHFPDPCHLGISDSSDDLLNNCGKYGAFASQIFCETVRKLTLDIEWLRRWMQIDHLSIWPIISVLGFDNNEQMVVVHLLSRCIEIESSLELIDKIFGFYHFLNYFSEPGDFWIFLFLSVMYRFSDKSVIVLIPRGFVMLFFSGCSMHSEELLTSLSNFPLGDSGGSCDEILIKSISGLINLIEMAPQKDRGFHIDV
jgi:hypothetical protein